MKLAAKNFLDTINSVLNKYAPLKRVNKYKLRSKNKPWITSGIQKSIYIKNKLLEKFINKKDPQSKAIFGEQYKTYRNLLSTLMKQSKQNYYTKSQLKISQLQHFIQLSLITKPLQILQLSVMSLIITSTL